MNALPSIVQRKIIQASKSAAPWNRPIAWSIAALLILATNNPSAFAGNPSSVELVAPSSSSPGFTCIEVRHACSYPQDSELLLDGQPMEAHEDLEGQRAHRFVCLEEGNHRPGSHEFVARSTCNGTRTQDRMSVHFSDQHLQLMDIEPKIDSEKGNEWLRGETLEFELQTSSPGLSISVELGEIDSEFVPGAEKIQDLGDGRYLVRYRIDPKNAIPTGKYPIGITLQNRQGKRRTYSNIFEIPFLRGEGSRFGPGEGANGSFEYDELPPTNSGGPLELQWVETSVRVQNDGSRPGQAILEGKVRSTQTLDGAHLEVNVREAHKEGYARIVVQPRPSRCDRRTEICESELSVPIAIRPHQLGSFQQSGFVDLELSLGISDDTVASSTPRKNAELDRKRAPLQIRTHVPLSSPRGGFVAGKLRFADLRQQAVVDREDPLYPQYGRAFKTSLLTGVEGATIRVEDRCDYSTTATVKSNGAWGPLWLPVCSTLGLRAYFVAHAKHSFYNVEVRRKASEPKVYEFDLGPIVADASDIVFVSPSTARDVAELLVEGVRAQKQVWTYLRLAKFFEKLPRLMFRFEAGKDADNDGTPDGTSSYQSQGGRKGGIVNICALPENPDQQDDQIIHHEISHWYQDMFMPRLTGNNSASPAGAVGEGFANTMTAIRRNMNRNGYLIQDSGTGPTRFLRSEFLDFSGNFRQDASGKYVAALPNDLYVTTEDGGSGGWSWRILWDLFDGQDSEPMTRFTRYNELDNSNPSFMDYGAFDQFGSAYKFRDVVTKYLGGNYLRKNPMRPDIDDQGFDGVDMTEFLDGMLCRGHVTPEKLERLVHDVMDFRRYEPDNAPATCP